MIGIYLIFSFGCGQSSCHNKVDIIQILRLKYFGIWRHLDNFNKFHLQPSSSYAYMYIINVYILQMYVCIYVYT